MREGDLKNERKAVANYSGVIYCGTQCINKKRTGFIERLEFLHMKTLRHTDAQMHTHSRDCENVQNMFKHLS